MESTADRVSARRGLHFFGTSIAAVERKPVGAARADAGLGEPSREQIVDPDVDEPSEPERHRRRDPASAVRALYEGLLLVVERLRERLP